MAAILKPLGNCAELLNQSAVNPMLSKCIDFAVNYITSLKDKDLKNKVIITFKGLLKDKYISIHKLIVFKDMVSVLELLVALKLISKSLFPDLACRMNDIRLEVILRMLKT